MFKDQLECYQAISEELIQVVKDQWDTIEIEARNTGHASINIKAFYTNKKGRHPIIDFIMLPRYFFELARLVSSEEKGFYKVCNFTLRSSGEYEANFQY